MKHQKLVAEGEKVLLAVSGGLDSMVMAHLFLKSEISFGIAHCNFGLRGEASDGDERFVQSWAEAHQVPYHGKRVD
ncbi:MAG: ATP-binding protein, partial [Bacteroidota bacterium]